ncbi:MAG TPA: M20/M25/M40 family metallo-hydrolase [candidate division Zixibacteria bacterium]|nr:M20/M25/M40 family metallo-hydrolase [candidate division Zixibacteria bacterium]
MSEYQQTTIENAQNGLDRHAKPVPFQDRIEVVDILRGFAIFGILLVNMYGFAGMDLNPQSYSGLNRIVIILILLLAQAKFYSLFSFLFGWGMWIQMSRAVSKGINIVPLYVRRMLVLLVIGILHGIFIWTGDILTVYAILGLLLLLFRNASQKTLLIAIALLLLMPIIVNLPGETMDGFRNGYAELGSFLRTFGQQDDSVYFSGTYGEITERRLQEFVGGQTWFIYWIGNVFSMFLLGFYAGKRGYFADISKNISTFRRTLVVGLVLGLLFGGASVLVTVRPDLVSPEWQRFVRVSTRTIGAPALMLFYVSTITLLTQRDAWRKRLGALAPVGRMALTNYLIQSLVLTLIFYGYGLALYGQIGPSVGLILTILVYASQIRFSAWWLKRYRFGPMEWLWRTLTYGQRQPLQRGTRTSEPRPIPGLARVRGWLSAIPPLVLLAIVWIGLLVWAVGLIRWNSRLSSDVYVDPFSEVVEGGNDGTVVDSATAPEGETEAAEQQSEIVAFMPNVQPVTYSPGSIVSSGDMRALADLFDYSRAMEHIDALSGREYSGRLAGSPGARDAGDYIAGKMDEYGLQPGGYDGTFFQPFPLTYTLLLDSPELAIVQPDGSMLDGYELYEDYAPFIYGYAGGGNGSGEIFWVNECQPEDFQGLDVVGKIVFCRAATSGQESMARSRRAIEYGAEGLLFLTDPERRPADFGYRHMEVWVPNSIPVLYVYPDVTDDILRESGIDASQLDEDTEPFPFKTTAQLEVFASGSEVVEARNILGVLPGRDPSYSDEVVIVGAHYDHMGQSPDGTYWPGANDNASGVAAMLEIARSWHEQGYVPRRTVLFAAWDAEEWGLIGSTNYVFHPSYPLEYTVASIQMDMVGAGSETLNIDGSMPLSMRLQAVAKELGIESEISELGRSDHVPFMQAGIPASLLIWMSEDVVIPHYHRPNDRSEVIEEEKLTGAAKVADITLLELVESEPAIRGMLSARASAAVENDQAAFLGTSREDQLNNDETWLADLLSYSPSVVDMTVDNLEIDGAMAEGDVRIRVQYPNPEDATTNQVIMVDLPVMFSRQGTDWTWAGPNLVLAEAPDRESELFGLPAFPVSYPKNVEANPWEVGVEAVQQYADIAHLLGIPVTSDSSIMLMPDASSIRVSTALSLPGDQQTWIGPKLIKIVHRENISQTEGFSTAVAQLLLANAGLSEDMAPWLWHGLPAALNGEEDLAGTHQRHLAVLHRSLAAEEVPTRDAGAWAAVDYLVKTEGWAGLGRIIRELGRACRQGSCNDPISQDATLQNVLGMNNAAFSAAWQMYWRSSLDVVQQDLDALLLARSNAVISDDQQAFLDTVDSSDIALVNSETNWFADLFQHPLDSFSLSAHPVTLLPNGDVLADVSTDFQLTGGGSESIDLVTMFVREGDSYRWAGPSMATLAGSNISIHYPDGQDQIASELLADAETKYANLAGQLGIDSPAPLNIDLLADNDEFQMSVALSFPSASWLRGYSSDGTAIRLRLLPVSTVADYSSELAIQLARQLLYQKGVDSEWLLKGVSTYLTYPLDNGAALQAAAATLPNLIEAVDSDSLPGLQSMPDDARSNDESYRLARAQAWDSVRYLVETYGWDALQELLSEQGSGADLDPAMRSVLGESVSSFTSNWETSFVEGHLPEDALVIVHEFDGETAQDHVDYLSSAELAGRLAGTDGADMAADYIAELFGEYGLQPAGDISGTTYYQTFFITTTAWAHQPYLQVDGDPQPYNLRADMLFSRATITGTETVSGEMVWIGDSPPDETDLSGKIMVAIASDSVEQQVDEAVSMGAEALLLLGVKNEIEDVHFKKPLSVESTAEIPVLELTREGTLRFLEHWGHIYMDLSQLEDVIPMEFGAEIGAKFEEPQRTPTANILGIMPGTDPYLANELIIVGAHYDHVGDDPDSEICSSNSSAGSGAEATCEVIEGQRYSGANDNASGVGAMLELIRLWQDSGYEPKRTILFAAWGAQEFGQLGSLNYIMTPTIPLSQTISMIQLDGLGGGEGFYAGIQGNAYSDGFPLHYAVLAARHLGEEIILTDLIAESDHLVFDEAGFPVLLFNWRLADENNLPDEFAKGVNPERLTSAGTLAAMTIMMLAQ